MTYLSKQFLLRSGPLYRLLDEDESVLAYGRGFGNGSDHQKVTVADRTYVARRVRNRIEYVDPLNSEVTVVFDGFVQDETMSAEIPTSCQQFRFVLSGKRPYLTMSCLNRTDEPELLFRLRGTRKGRPSVPPAAPPTLLIVANNPAVEVIRPQITLRPEMLLLTLATARRFKIVAGPQAGGAGNPKV